MLKLILMKLGLLQKYSQLILLCFISLIIIFIYRFPDVYAYLTTPPGMIFLGQNTWFDPHDVNVYVSVIHHSQSGNFLLPNLWTALPNKPILIFLFEQSLGFFLRSTNPYFLFWVTSIACGSLLIVVIYYLVRKSVHPPFLAAATTLGISLGGGFGFLFFSNNISSSDISKAITFYDAFLKPHEAISIGCYLYALVMFYEIIIRQKVDYIKACMISLSLVIAFSIYAYLIATYLLITIPVLLRSKVRLDKKYLAIIYFPSMITVGLVAWQLFSNQGFSDPLTQHLTTEPMATLLGYGILLPIFCYQLFFLKKTSFIYYLNWWIIITLFLSLLPLGPGKIFLRGLFFPLVLVSVLQINSLLNKVKLFWIKICIWFIFFIMLCITNIYIMFLRDYASHTDQSNEIIYMQRQEFSVFSYLNEHAPPNSGILAEETMSNLIPAYTFDRSCIGDMGSINQNYFKKLNAVYAFYAGQPVSENYLAQNNIDYVLWGPREQATTNRYARGNINDLRLLYKNLRLVYETQTTKLYQVK